VDAPLHGHDRLPRQRADQGSTRSIPANVVDLLCQHKDDEPTLTVPLLIRRVREKHRDAVSDELPLPESTVHRLLARRGFAIDPAVIERDLTQRHAGDPRVEAAWLTIYRAPREHWDLYELGEELVDLEDAFRLWRFRHVSTVERIIGFKPGTGGTSGVAYLRKMLEVVLFPELWKVRTDL